MNTNLIASLRIAVSALACVICFAPANANAYTSNGTDGQFQPAVSMALDATQQIFNFTSIFIPSDVTVSFSGLTSAQPIELLATRNIDIAGKLDVGASNLWIETPGSISLSGSLYSGGDLSLVANGINVTGIMNTTGGNITLTSGGGILTSSVPTFATASAPTFATARSGVISLGRDAITARGTLVLADVGTLVFNEGGDISICSNCSILSPVPESDVWVMLLLGLCALFAISRLRYQNIRLA